jgi:CHAT domain-containing protein/Tfp pilus assembly protein PilF
VIRVLQLGACHLAVDKRPRWIKHSIVLGSFLNYLSFVDLTELSKLKNGHAFLLACPKISRAPRLFRHYGTRLLSWFYAPEWRYLLVTSIIFLSLLRQTSCAQEPISENRLSLRGGLIVESLEKTREGARAGIHPGDILMSWSRGDARGKLESPFDLLYLANEQASRGPLMIAGLRDSTKKVWVLGAESWGIVARPNLQADLLAVYERGRELAEEKRVDEAIEQWRKAATLAVASKANWLASWFFVHAAKTVGPDAKTYQTLLQEAIENSTEASPMVLAEIHIRQAYGFLRQNDFAGTEDCFEKAAKEWRRLDAELAASTAISSAGWAAQRYGNMDKAEEDYRESLRLAQRADPTSRQALFGLTYVGGILQNRGDFTSAETYYVRALAIAEKRHLRDISVARIVTGLAVLDHQRGNLPGAEMRYRQALTIVKEVDPDGLELAGSLSNLAECLIDEGHTQTAEKYETRALEIRQRLSPRSLAVALSYRNFGKIARIRKDWDQAYSYYLKALDIGESVAPSSESTCRFLIGLGYVARDREQSQQAETYFRRALIIIERLRPNSLEHAELLADLASAIYHEGRIDDAAVLYRQAIDEIENKTFALGGEDDDRSLYRASHVRYYKEYVDLLLAQGRPEQALEQLEASRARTLLEMLAQSQIHIRQGIEPVLLTRERDLRRSIGYKLDDRTHLLEKKEANETLAAIDTEIATLREEYQRVQTEIRIKVPSYAALVKPQPLSRRELQALLDPETILLEYSIGEERSHVWAVTAHSVDVYDLPERAKIEESARTIYSALTARVHGTHQGAAGQQTGWAGADVKYWKSASSLSHMILDPVAAHLPGKRILIVPDDSLQLIPFSALPAPGRSGTPLIAEHEVVTLPSLSLVREIRRAKETHPKASGEVAVLADPVFDSEDERMLTRNGAPRVRGSLGSDLRRSVNDLHLGQSGKMHFARLIYTRREAQAVLSATPAGKAMAALDFQANRLLALSPVLSKYRIVHFATHGLLNSTHPALSGLVFSLVDERGHPQDGFLKLQDIYNLNLPVEMVVLSGCDTGLGQQISGEGLIGLTRGFIHAAASRVVASLWSVDDRATAELMARFYKGMEQDKLQPTAALRAAQLQMLHQEHWQSPYYWAAFQINGDWR